MRQITREQNPSGFLDPEKVYFVEKFGYLIKNIDNGFGGPVQDALIQRIFKTVDKFKTDLPIVVRDLEKNRLKNVTKKKTNGSSIAKPQEQSGPKPSQIKTATIENREQIKESASESKKKVIEAEIEVDINVKNTPQIVTTQTSTIKRSPILKPSTAAIIEENRQRQLKKLQEKELEEKQEKPIPLVTRPKVRPKKELTVWERAWHRYGGYTEDILNGHS